MPGHGGNVRQLALHAGRSADEILDFSASVNPLGPPPLLRAVLSREMDRLDRYPDAESAELVAAIAAHCCIPAEFIVAGNGSSELLFAAARALPYCRALIPVPSYIDYAAAVRAARREVVEFPLAEAAGFELDFAALDAALRPGDLVILGQPNNPTGLVLDADQLRALVTAHADAWFLIDEAFAGFIDGYRSLLDDLPANVVLLRSLTKLYAIAGLRLGFAAARPAAAAFLRAAVPPWSVNSLAQAAGVAVLSEEDYLRRSVAAVACQCQRLAQELGRLPGLHVYPGAANYLLLRLARSDLDAFLLAQRLLSEGIAVRTFGPGQHLDGRFFRVAVRTADENAALCGSLARILGGPPPPHIPRRTPALMFQGTTSNAGKSLMTAALCRIMLQDGIRVAPFKSQNMSLNSFVTRDGHEMGRAQVVQAQACRLEPDVRMNPILLKPNSDTGCQVIVRGRPVGNMRVGEYVDYKPNAWDVARECYDSLAADFDAVVLEGAGSPGEVNLKHHDIVNMRMAGHAGARVLIVGDIDRGGLFAALVGTWEVLEPWERKLVAGWVVNRFRGDASLLGPALDYTLRRTGRPVLGVVPYLAGLNVPEEDSVEFKSQRPGAEPPQAGQLEIAVIDLPHLSNFTDFDAFRVESEVHLQIVRSPAQLNRPDAVLLGGSKNTLGDLAYLRSSGLAARLAELAARGGCEIAGICGGFQMLGLEVGDPLGIESADQVAIGLGLLDVKTTMAAQKTLVRTTARHMPSGLEVSGYEIHHGRTDVGLCQAAFCRPDGQVLGAASADGHIWGTYLHGVFDADPFRRWFLDRLRARRGLPPVGEVVASYDIEPALDRLAEAVRGVLPIPRIYELMGLR